MGGYYSGRRASNEKSIEAFYAIDICQLYRDGALTTGKITFVRFSDGYFVKIKCKEQFWGWKHCLKVKYPIWGSDHKIEVKDQVIGFEMVDVLKGKAQRPYFFCPQLECHASKLFLGDTGFAHRSYHGNLYDIQRMGHFDRSIKSCRKIQEKLSCSLAGAASEPPSRPKGMHRKTYARYLKKHARASRGIIQQLGSMAFM